MGMTDGGLTPVRIPSWASTAARAFAFSLAGPLLKNMMKFFAQPSVIGERYNAFCVGKEAPLAPGSA